MMTLLSSSAVAAALANRKFFPQLIASREMAKKQSETKAIIEMKWHRPLIWDTAVKAGH